ncbi:ENTH/VHS [Ostreococcus tauri]|uniref:ENTH/VHS n=1 Tax=Ostreococcus tauri TaxID=70448 RepID=Q01FW5_OSTTA|nr:ENTH/VHS [Ostreococcus tauri]CAL50379.1 ENTH/VHS [Ostreococcus tauri]|eukprot:XP_003074528.1 ENTH/VHS [Ostreococcus tauri]
MSSATTPDAEIDVADRVGCAKCRWSLGGCGSCRTQPPSDRARCPPLHARPGYVAWAKRNGIVVNARAKAATRARTEKMTEGARKKAKTRETADSDEAEFEEATRAKRATTLEREADRETVNRETAERAVVERTREAAAREAAAREAAAREAAAKQFTVDVDCGRFRSDIVGRHGDNLKVLRFKSGARVQVHPENETMIQVYGTRERIVKAKEAITEALQKAEERAKERAARGTTPVKPKKPALNVMNIVNDMKKPIERDSLEALAALQDRSQTEEAEVAMLDAQSQAAVDDFLGKLSQITRSRQSIFEITSVALAMSSREGVPEAVVSTLREQMSNESTSASTRLTLLFVVDSIAQASNVESRGGSHAVHAMYTRALRKHIADIIKHVIAVIKVDEATEMKGVEVPDGATIGEAHARYRRQAVQKVLAIWEKRGVMGANDIAIGKKAISKFRHEHLKKRAREFDARLERQPEAKIKVQSDGLNANEFDDIAAMLGNQYGGIDASGIDLSMLRAKRVDDAADTPASPKHTQKVYMDWDSAPPQGDTGAFETTRLSPGSVRDPKSAHRSFLTESGELD